MKAFKIAVLTLVCLIFSPPYVVFLLDIGMLIMADRTLTGLDWGYKSNRMDLMFVWMVLTIFVVLPTHFWAFKK